MATVCQKCGVTGYSELLIHCSGCKIAAEHRYCLDKMLDRDVLQVHWSCEQCKAGIHKLASLSKPKHRSSRIARKLKHNNICRNKYGHQGTPRAITSPLSLKYQNENFSGLEDTESSAYESIRPPCSSSVASASKIDEPCAGLLQKEVPSIVHSSSKSVRDDKSRTHGRRLILAKDEVDDENCRPSSSRVIEDQRSDRAETHDAERNILGHQMFIDHQLYELARPIIFWVWSGFFEICNEEHGPIKAHLSNKACEKVCSTAVKLPPVLQMAKLSKLEAWPRSFNNSPPTGDNIALFFFPDSTRAKSMLDHLLGDVISKDLVLKVVLNEAELLVFPSVILPEVYHRFRGNFYLWGVFKGRQVPVHSVPASCCSKADDLPVGEEKMQDSEHVEEEISSRYEKSAVVLGDGKGAEEEDQRMDDSEPSGEMENVEAVGSGKVAEEDQRTDDSGPSGAKEGGEAERKYKVGAFNHMKGKEQVEAYDESSSNITDDGSDNDLCNHLVILGKKIPVTSTAAECPPNDPKMGNWEVKDEQLDHEHAENCLSLFPLRVEDMAIRYRVGGCTALDLELGLGLSAGDGRGKGMPSSDSPANIFLDRDV